VVQEAGEGAKPVQELIAARRHLVQKLGSEGQPDAGRLHLLLRQLDLTRAHVLERAHLDLLESHHLLRHQHLALLGQESCRLLAARRWRIQTPLALTASVK
jgi:hypothetical protein